ncbi:hypothetical protein GCM10010124_12200 [Pilimelia terevasa]|uniref:Pyrrolo-quinoline quinone repeat domain-containing protein n=1 Tax=Pilimelia terevasa TaxID=53372 RepID=A0A8J3BM75_9ACTN|nr:PQQ-binding-like beta-propeller repeat protein [Pilimelia terevasa]GGK21258.1 hypothetical protein GCM10010124_12200 [Pilimelia terevasa]
MASPFTTLSRRALLGGAALGAFSVVGAPPARARRRRAGELPAVRWRAPLPGAFDVHAGTVYRSTPGKLHAHAAADGAVRWEVPSHVQAKEAAHLVAAGPRAVAAVARYRKAGSPAYDAHAETVDGGGRPLGAVRSCSGVPYWFDSTLVRAVQASNSSYHWVAAHAEDGSPLWSTSDGGSRRAWLATRPLAGQVSARALLVRDRTEDRPASASLVDVRTCAPSWTLEGVLSGGEWGYDSGGHLVLPTEADGAGVGAGVRRLDAATGGTVWSVPADLLQEAVPYRDSVLVGGAVGTVRSLDAATGAPRWQVDVARGFERMRLAVSGGTLLVRYNATVYPLDAATGAPRGGAWPGYVTRLTADATGVYAAVDDELLAFDPLP